jgi:hypothetical protein
MDLARAQQAHGGLAKRLHGLVELPPELLLVVLLVRHARLRRLYLPHQMVPPRGRRTGG